MKKSRHLTAVIISSLTLSLGVEACGRINSKPKPPPSQAPELPSSKLPQEAEEVDDEITLPSPKKLPKPTPTASKLTDTYLGKNLVLVPHATNWGWIKIKGDDAKALYRALTVTVRKDAESPSWLPTKSREGINTLCSEQAKKSAPTQVRHDCFFYIDYHSGRLLLRNHAATLDTAGDHLVESYKGKHLQLFTADSTNNYGVVSLQGDDAKALYSTLAVSPIQLVDSLSQRPMLTKRGQDLSCFKLEASNTYWCHFYINYKNGEVIKR